MNELSIFDSILNDVMGNGAVNSYVNASVPVVDVKETKEAYNLEMELPGRTENDVEINLDHDTLTISSKKEEKKAITDKSEEKAAESEKNEEKPENKTRWLIRERRISEFSRSFQLPQDVDQENVSASFRNGILYVTLPRKEKAAAKRIEIKAA